MNASNKLKMSVLSLLVVSTLAACDNSSQKSNIESTESAPTETLSAIEETSVILERIQDPKDESATQSEIAANATFTRQYTVTEGENKIIASFRIGSEKYGNKNTPMGEVEYVINDLCADENCSQIVSIISKVSKDQIKQDTYLFKFDSDKYSLVCKEEDTNFEQQEDALAFLTASCKVIE